MEILKKYAKGIAAAVTLPVVTAIGVWSGWTPEVIATQAGIATVAVGTLINMLLVVIVPNKT